MRQTLRTKLVFIVGSAALTLAAVIGASSWLSSQVAERLRDVHARQLPRLERGSQLLNDFDALSQRLRDAVSNKDLAELERQRAGYDALVASVHEATKTGMLEAVDGAAIEAAVDAFFHRAVEVGRRMIAQERGDDLLAAIAESQERRARVSVLIRSAIGSERDTLNAALADVVTTQREASQVRLGIGLVGLSIVLVLSLVLSRGVLAQVRTLTEGFERFGRGDLSRPLVTFGDDELTEVGRQANVMAARLQKLADQREHDDWVRGALAGLTDQLRGDLTPSDAAERAVGFVARYFGAVAGALYLADDQGGLERASDIALEGATDVVARFRLGEGLVGEVGKRRQPVVLEPPPEGYLAVRSGLGRAAPKALVVAPLVHVGRTVGVLELALLSPFTDRAREGLALISEPLAIKLEVAAAHQATKTLLARTQELAQRLGTQEEELRVTNEELQVQQEELRRSNSELSHQTEELERQQRVLEERNAQLDLAQQVLGQRADELATVSSYKSQFLTNMSHELRTPLNSMLLLSSLLAENEKQNLTDEQVTHAKTIHSAGRDLLALINQVLDLSKVEAGKQELNLGSVQLTALTERAQAVFAPLAREKGLQFEATIDPGLPAELLTDRHRIDQVLTNLLGNAIKFTERGGVALQVKRAEPGRLAFHVKDSGPGIAHQDQARIFAPFEQLDTAVDRRHGGTGLGLTIAKQLAALLGGELRLESTVGVGTTFTFVVPEVGPAAEVPPPQRPPPPEPIPPRASPRTFSGAPPTLLVIEDDRTFADAFAGVIRGQGLECLLAKNAAEGLELARTRKPSGIVLDVKLPDGDGFELLEQLKNDPATQAIPVHFVSAIDAKERGLAAGAVGYLTKPVTSTDLLQVIETLAPRGTEHSSAVLVVEDDVLTGESIAKRLRVEGLEVRHVTSASRALEALEKERFGCLVLDLQLQDMDGLQLLQKMQELEISLMPSVVVHTARALSVTEARRLEAYTEAIVIKDGPSIDRVLNEIRLFVRRLKDGAPRRAFTAANPPLDVRLSGKRALVVDDDMRNVYALSATLRAKGVHVLTADTGLSALQELEQHPDVDVVLMDIMMPEMDGYEAMRRIRAQPRFSKLPIVALTAKAMKGDEERCRDAGASDYLPKPLDMERLLRLLNDRIGTGAGSA